MRPSPEREIFLRSLVDKKEGSMPHNATSIDKAKTMSTALLRDVLGQKAGDLLSVLFLNLSCVYTDGGQELLLPPC